MQFTLILPFTFSQIWHHPPECTDVYGVNYRSLAQRAFSLRAFLGQYVALEGLGPDDLARAGFFESLGGGAIGPDLGHYLDPSCSVVSGAKVIVYLGRGPESTY
jgi:hypothetical protein